MPTLEVPLNKETTPPQIIMGSVDVFTGRLPRSRQNSTAWYRKVRAMRLDPTLALARIISLAPLMLANWSVEKEEDAPDGAADLIAEQFMPLRSQIIESAHNGRSDFGWIGYEKVIDYKNGANVLCKLKPLLQDRTDILVDPATGCYLGLEYRDIWGGVFQLPREKTLLISANVEGTDFYGQGKMAVAELAYDKWNEVEEGASRYDRKIAGAHWIIGYPLGVSTVNGVEKDNALIAADIAEFLKASGCICIPTTLTDDINQLNQQKDTKEIWYVKLESDSSGAQSSFVDRLKYIDALKVRAWGLPERSLLEGQFGTKAEAGDHGDFAIMGLEVEGQDIVRHVNWHGVNQILTLNYGPEAQNTVYLKAAPLADIDREFLRKVFDNLMKGDLAAVVEAMIDREALFDRLAVPILPKDDIDALGVIDPSRGLPEYDENADPNIDPAIEGDDPPIAP